MMKSEKEECEFGVLKNGRICCKTHNQTLIYLYSNGRRICQVGEDLMVTKLGGLGKYIKFINKSNNVKSLRDRIKERNKNYIGDLSFLFNTPAVQIIEKLEADFLKELDFFMCELKKKKYCRGCEGADNCKLSGAECEYILDYDGVFDLIGGE